MTNGKTTDSEINSTQLDEVDNHYFDEILSKSKKENDLGAIRNKFVNQLDQLRRNGNGMQQPWHNHSSLLQINT